MAPAGDLQRGDLTVQSAQNGLELRLHECRVLFHQLQGVSPVLEIEHMALLVHLVIGDGLNTDPLLKILQVGFGGSHAGHTVAGEGDLGGGGELVDHIIVAVLLALVQNVRELHIVAVKLVDAVRIIPHDREVRRGGLHGGHTDDGILGVDDALGVGILGHAPDALHRRVLDGLLHGVHVRTGGGHGNGDELKAEGFRQLEVAVIAGGGAQPLDNRLLAPGAGAVEAAMDKGAVDHAVHELQTGVAAHEYLLGLAVQKVCEQALGLRQTGQRAVVADINAVDNIVLRLLEHIEDVRYHVQLILAGLAAGHVQLQSLCLQICKSGLQCCVFSPPLVQCHVFVCSHLSHPLRVVPEVLCGAKAPVNNLLYYTHLLAEIQGLFLSRIIKTPGKRGKILRFSFLFSKNMLQSTKMTAISAQGGPFWKINSKRSIN